MVCEALTRLRVKPRAIVSAHRLERQRQHYRVANDRFQIHLGFVNLVVIGNLRRIREKLLKIDLKVYRDLVEAPHALGTRRRASLTRHQNAVVQAFQTQVELELSALGHDRRSGAELLGRHEVDGLLAHLAGAVHDVAHIHAIKARGGRHSGPV